MSSDEYVYNLNLLTGWGAYMHIQKVESHRCTLRNGSQAPYQKISKFKTGCDGSVQLVS